MLERKIPITRIKMPVESEVRYYSWSGSVIGKMLRNPVYKGDHVVCKCHQKAIRSNTVNFIPRDQWEIIENCHEAIVSREQWDRVQKLIDRRPTIMQGNSCPFYNLFHGLVYCATCGKSMEVRYEKVGRTDIDRSTKKKREPIDRAYYICQTYNRLGKKACTSHMAATIVKAFSFYPSSGISYSGGNVQPPGSPVSSRYAVLSAFMQK